MPIRLEPFTNNCIYHVFNKTIDHKEIFNNKTNCIQFLNILRYYRSSVANYSYSKFLHLESRVSKIYLQKIETIKTFRVELLAYCLMPTHFHLLIKQKKDKGISRFMADIINSFTRYYNLKSERKGPIFLSNFKSVRIMNDNQFTHVSRYIHLNPFSSGLITNINKLESYLWSSYKDYLQNNNGLISSYDLMTQFNNNKEKYKNFVLSNAEYQKTLEEIKHAEKW